MNQKELLALISLIDDDSEEIFLHVRDRLMEYGTEAVPSLESMWLREGNNDLFQARIENVLHDIQLEECKRKLVIWFDSPQKDLLEGAIIVAQYNFPNLDPQEVYDEVERIRRDCWLEMNQYQTAFEKVKILNNVFFGMYSFEGERKNPHSPFVSYINSVLSSKKGNPLSLSILYSVVAQKLQIPIYGVNLPNQFIIAYLDENHSNQFVSDANEYGVLMYINPYSKGIIFQKQDILQFLTSIKVAPEPSHFQPCSNSDIIRRMLTNLMGAYQSLGQLNRVQELSEMRMLIS